MRALIFALSITAIHVVNGVYQDLGPLPGEVANYGEIAPVSTIRNEEQ